MQREAEHAVVAPVADFLADVDQRGRLLLTVGLHAPYAAGLFPDHQLSVGSEGQTQGLAPAGTDGFLHEAARKGQRRGRRGGLWLVMRRLFAAGSGEKQNETTSDPVAHRASPSFDPRGSDECSLPPHPRSLGHT